MKWKNFAVSKPAINSYILASDGKSISLFRYPEITSLHSSCCGNMSLEECKYWTYITEVPYPECSSCYNQQKEWNELMDPGIYKEMVGAAETIQEQKIANSYRAVIGDDDIFDELG